MSHFFQFESDFVESLHCIPMTVRYKLDTCGVKLKLAQWNQFSPDDRQQLVELPCDTDAAAHHYREQLRHLIHDRTHTEMSTLETLPNPPWLKADQVPVEVQAKAQEVGATLSLTNWAKLTPIQRFALIKLSRSSHENANFIPALKEFAIL